MNEVDINLSTGIRLKLAEAGRGGRPLLLVHGFTGGKEDFTEWLDLLAARGWHAVAADNRGHGDSAKPERRDDYSFDLLASDTLALADELWERDGRFVLLGHSLGGMVAQVVALQSPDRLDGLVLMGTAPGRLSIAKPSQAAKLVGIMEACGIDGYADLIASRDDPLSTPAHRRLIEQRPGYAEFGDRKLRATAAPAFIGLLLAISEAKDRLDDLRSLDVPTLVIVGEQDEAMLAPSHAMAGAIPGAELAVLEDAGHSPQFENPDAWSTALFAFLDSLPERST